MSTATPDHPRSATEAPGPAPVPPGRRRPWLALAIVLAVLLLVAWGFWRAAQPAPLYFQGQMEARETDIAPKVTARIAKVRVTEGQKIQPGDLLVEMDSPEVRAKLAQAEAARDAAQAQADKAQAGARPQEVQMARLNWQRAQTAADLAQTSLRRVQSLFDQGLVAAQKRDEADANWRASRDQALAARAQYEMAASGARQEDRSAAQAQARQVQGVVAEVEAARAETELRSPVGGEVVQVLARQGELSPQGVAVVTVVDLADRLDHFLDAGLGFKQFLTYFAVKMPLVFAQILPAVFLLALIIQIGLMVRNREMMALRAGGISPGWFIRFFIVYGLFYQAI